MEHQKVCCLGFALKSSEECLDSKTDIMLTCPSPGALGSPATRILSNKQLIKYVYRRGWNRGWNREMKQRRDWNNSLCFLENAFKWN